MKGTGSRAIFGVRRQGHEKIIGEERGQTVQGGDAVFARPSRGQCGMRDAGAPCRLCNPRDARPTVARAIDRRRRRRHRGRTGNAATARAQRATPVSADRPTSCRNTVARGKVGVHTRTTGVRRSFTVSSPTDGRKTRSSKTF